MDIHFGPKLPNRVIRIRAGAKVLRIASDSIRDAVWEPDEGIHDDRFFDFSDLKIIPYYSECSLYIVCPESRHKFPTIGLNMKTYQNLVKKFEPLKKLFLTRLTCHEFTTLPFFDSTHLS